MNKIILLVLIAISLTCSASIDSRLSKDAFAQSLGIELAMLEGLESRLKVRREANCILSPESCSEIQPLIDSCKDSPFPNICITTTIYRSLTVQELCNNDLQCVNLQNINERKVVTFFHNNAQEAGYGRLAVNVCFALHEYKPSQEHINDLAELLNVGNGTLTSFFDYTTMFECIQDTYKKAVLDGIK